MKVLVADDKADILEALRLLLKGEGFAVVTQGSPQAVLRAVEQEDFDVVLIDLNYSRDTTSGKEGLDLLATLRALDAALPVVVMTAWGSVEGAIEAMRRGARDYVQKPWENARLVATLRAQAELGRALRRARLLEQENANLRKSEEPAHIAESRAMQPVLRIMERVAPSDAAVLVMGEHGTGKEVIARELHARSRRAEEPFVAVNAGGLSEGIFESELFGHVKGAFTDAKSDRVGAFELAHGGTLFLDEIGNMPLSQQAKLLRVLQTGEFHPVGSSKVRRADVRLISATNADLRGDVAAGRFREDLLYRVNTVEVRLPPLRERGEDIVHLASYFLQRHAARYASKAKGFEPEALRLLQSHAWPGNVRELAHTIERAVLMAPGELVGPADLALTAAAPRASASPFEGLTLEEVERMVIERALERHDRNVTDAARALGLSRSALYRRLQQFGLKGVG
jgi:DNA-binding NtrC family response regulator